jgi:hypothetical protein
MMLIPKHRKIKILRRAIDILTTRKKWGKHEFAKDAKGNAVSPWSKQAVCLCALGALSVAADPRNKAKLRLIDDGAADPVLPVVEAITRDVESSNTFSFQWLTTWNDDEKRDKRQVIRALEKAIQYIQDQP